MCACATGAQPRSLCVWTVGLLLLAGLAAAVPLGWRFGLVVAGYVAATTAYSLYFKR